MLLGFEIFLNGEVSVDLGMLKQQRPISEKAEVSSSAVLARGTCTNTAQIALHSTIFEHYPKVENRTEACFQYLGGGWRTL